ncbi:lysophospholipase [Brevibacillus sp. SYP-B805]|uniref:GDSL-type esterase/lipase family protein n=1 Tax=Brevibacillus sp. SYP-B805 TaxID=1578199 RepID=UPI0013EBFEB3|nr:GDSL-type esterase/lipase family protein [Brevibacillus sp. SYP-B805]NGQ95384.1 lysophospholipase [Brevibacillus sp. SYP-B805]
MHLRTGQTLWRTTFTISVLSLLLFIAGFLLALNPFLLRSGQGMAPSAGSKPVAPSAPLPEQGKLTVVALGDSLTRGAGDASGLGYVGLVREALEKQRHQSLILHNLAINGQQSSGLLAQLEQPQIRRLVADADLIVFTIGGNDLFQQSGGVYQLDEKKLDAAMNSLTTNFGKILSQLRELNGKAPILYTALYNPFGDTEAAQETAAPVLAWNGKAAEIASRVPGVMVVPTYDLFVQKENKYLYTDHFHPNHAGYQRIADRIMQALE